MDREYVLSFHLCSLSIHVFEECYSPVRDVQWGGRIFIVAIVECDVPMGLDRSLNAYTNIQTDIHYVFQE